MKPYAKRISILILATSLATGFSSCQDQAYIDTQEVVFAESNHIESAPQSIIVDLPKVAPTPTLASVEQAPIETVVDSPLAAKGNDPFKYARSIFDDTSDIEPWRANYVGSYGVLPTRFQDRGPFLYSFDISPDADIFHDDDFGPLDFEERWFDDDDE